MRLVVYGGWTSRVKLNWSTNEKNRILWPGTTADQIYRSPPVWLCKILHDNSSAAQRPLVSLCPGCGSLRLLCLWTIFWALSNRQFRTRRYTKPLPILFCLDADRMCLVARQQKILPNPDLSPTNLRSCKRDLELLWRQSAGWVRFHKFFWRCKSNWYSKSSNFTTYLCRCCYVLDKIISGRNSFLLWKDSCRSRRSWPNCWHNHSGIWHSMSTIIDSRTKMKASIKSTMWSSAFGENNLNPYEKRQAFI